MKQVQNVKDFKEMLDMNREKVLANVIEAGKIQVNDEWMQDNRWDEIYRECVND